jgi:hypothetical protein
VSYADRLGLDVARFTEDLQGHVGANRIAQEVDARCRASADRRWITDSEISSWRGEVDRRRRSGISLGLAWSGPGG